MIRIGGGVIWADVYRELDPRNLSAAGTRSSMIGVVGSVLGGGISFFSHRHGWACDNVIEFEVVLANSSIVRASETANADLFWALRGGGNNFGIVTRLTLEIFHQVRSWYGFQRWDIRSLGAVFDRLDKLSRVTPPEMQMIATTLGWSKYLQEFVISDRIVTSDGTSDLLGLAERLPLGDPSSEGKQEDKATLLEEFVYERTTLEMAEVMDFVNQGGYFNFHGSLTVKSNPELNIRIADIFREEAKGILDAPGIEANIVYNPVTIPTIEKMKRRGGNALGIEPSDGPLTIININMQWSNEDTSRMERFMQRKISRFEDAARKMRLHHPYIFMNHCYKEQNPLLSYSDRNIQRLHRVREAVDPEGVFQVLQPGYHKLGMKVEDSWSAKSEL